jgi:hypothetical protein
MNTLRLLAFIARMVAMSVFGYLYVYFKKAYDESKKTEMRNTYFLGFMLLFGILTLFNLFYGLYGLYNEISATTINLDQNFAWWENPGNALDELKNQMRPLYLSFYFFLTCILAAQVYPLEQAMNWKKSPFSKTMILFGSGVWLLFIPAVAYTMVAYVIIGLSWLSFVMGFLLNIGVNIKIYKVSAGTLRKRALYAILAFFFLAIGIAWSLELGWGSSIYSGIENSMDVIIGSAFQLISALFYLKGFSLESFK